MNLRTIEIFVTVVEDEGLTAAAKRLNLSQSAVSQAITSLEEALGHKLLDRSVRPARTTLVGNDFLQRAVALLDCARELEQVTDLSLKRTLPHLRIGIVDSFASVVGPHLMQELEDLAAQWTVTSSLTDVGTRALMERRVDFLITSEEPRPDTDLLWLPIAEEPFFIIAPKALKSKASSLRYLVREVNFVRYGHSSFIDQKAEIYFREHGLRPRERYRLDTTDAVLAMVRGGLGWSISTPLCVLKNIPRSSDFMFLPLHPPMIRTLFLVSRKAEGNNLAHRIAEVSRRIFAKHCVPAIQRLDDWITVKVFQDEAEARGHAPVRMKRKQTG